MDQSYSPLQLIKFPNYSVALLILFLGVAETVAQTSGGSATQQIEDAVVEEPVPRPDTQQPESQAANKIPNKTASSTMSSNSSAPWASVVSAMIPAFAALFGALVGGWVARANATAANNQRANEVEINQLQKKLDDFYGRFQIISGENKLIANEFRKRQAQGFRTLVALLNANWLDNLPSADQAIVKSMVDNGKELRKLIRENAGLVDISVHPYLAKVSAHFFILELAYEKKLSNDPQNFSHYVYPEKLDGVLDLEIERLKERISLLISKSDKRHKPMGSLEIPEELRL